MPCFRQFFARVAAPSLGAVVAVSLSAMGALAAPPASVNYTVSVASIPEKKFHVTARAEGVTDPQFSFAIPAWSPGWYVLTNAWKNVSGVSAKDGTGKPLTVTHPDKYTWTVATNGAKSVTLAYDVLAKDQDPEAIGPGGRPLKDYGFFAPYLDEQHGFAPGPAVLVYAVDGKTAPCKVTYKVPQGWKIATANDPTSDPTTFSAKDYDTLADQPAELGMFARSDKKIGGVPFSVVTVGEGDTSTRRFVDDCWKIAEAGIKVYGVTPFPRYTFFFHFVGESPAEMGLEHLNSTVIQLPNAAIDRGEKEAYNQTLSIVAHEYTHAWNVKRIRSASLGPFDYTKEVRTKDLWWLEGVTDYFAPRLVVEAGLAGPDFWRGYMSEQISELESNDARKRVTLETASLKAWEGRSEGFGGLSYYTKGLVVGLLLDVEMRKRTANKVGVQDLLKALFKEAAESGKGFPDGEIERIASQLTGTDMKPFFDKALRSTDDLDYSVLSAAGIDFRAVKQSRPDFGIEINSLSLEDDNLKVGTVTPEGPAAKAGLKDGDVIVTIDDKPVLRAIGPSFQTKQPGDELALGIKRNGQNEKILLTLGEKTQTSVRLGLLPDMTAEQKAVFTSISGAGTVLATEN